MEFLPYPHLIATLFNGCACGPPKPFTAPSSWTWIDHPVSGLRYATLRPFQTWFPSGSGCPHPYPRHVPQLAGPFYKKYAVALSRVTLPPVVNTGFQVLFHSPPGVLFTFPSRYCSTIGHWVVFSLGGWSPRLPTRFPVSRGTPDSARRLLLRLRGFHALWQAFPKPFRFDQAPKCSP